jgi:hypothetical protein
VISWWETRCRISFLNEGSMFITLDKTPIHSTLCLGSIFWYMVDKDSDNKLYLRTISGWEVVTFFDAFPKTNFWAFWSDLLNDIWWVKKRIRDKVPDLLGPDAPNSVQPKILDPVL